MPNTYTSPILSSFHEITPNVGILHPISPRLRSSSHAHSAMLVHYTLVCRSRATHPGARRSSSPPEQRRIRLHCGLPIDLGCEHAYPSISSKDDGIVGFSGHSRCWPEFGASCLLLDLAWDVCTPRSMSLWRKDTSASCSTPQSVCFFFHSRECPPSPLLLFFR